MKKDKSNISPITPHIYSYTHSKSSLATIIDKKTMEQVHYDLENPAVGTASLNHLLQQIDRERRT